MDAVGSTRLAPQPAWDRDRDFLPASPGAQPGDEGPGFRAFLSAINPLPHIPVIGAVYRYVTGEKSHPAAQVVGGFVFGGPIGMAIAALGAAFEHATGKTPLEMAIDTIRGAGPAEVATAGEPGAGDADPPGAGAEAGASAGGQPGPAPAAAPIALAQAPAAGTASATPRGGDDPVDALHRPRVAGARDLAFYQAHAGARLPFAAPASSPAARLASLSPAAIPGPGAADAGALPAIPPPPPPLAPPILQPPTRQATVQAAQRPASRVEAAQATSPAQGQDFASRMLHGLDRYRSMRVGGDGRAAILDRTE